MKTIVLTIALAMMTVVAFGQNNQAAKATDEVQTETQTQVWKGPFFVDDNNNGICDLSLIHISTGKRLHQGEGVPQQELRREPEGEQLLVKHPEYQVFLR